MLSSFREPLTWEEEMAVSRAEDRPSTDVSTGLELVITCEEGGTRTKRGVRELESLAFFLNSNWTSFISPLGLLVLVSLRVVRILDVV